MSTMVGCGLTKLTVNRTLVDDLPSLSTRLRLLVDGLPILSTKLRLVNSQLGMVKAVNQKESG